jgi:hypothetical protein
MPRILKQDLLGRYSWWGRGLAPEEVVEPGRSVILFSRAEIPKEGIQSGFRILTGRNRFPGRWIGQFELKFLAEIGPGAVSHPFGIGDIALVVRRGSMKAAVPATVQIGVAPDTGFLESGLSFVARFPVSVTLMAFF